MSCSEACTLERVVESNNQIKSLIRVESTHFRVKSVFSIKGSLQEILCELIKESQEAHKTGVCDEIGSDKIPSLSYNISGK